MKDTIKAKIGFKVSRGKNKFTGEPCRALYDGEELILAGHVRTYTDYLDELEGNEMAHFCEKFTTLKGNEFIYWRDEEIDKDYITKLGGDKE